MKSHTTKRAVFIAALSILAAIIGIAKAIPIKILPRSEVFERIFVKDYG